MTDKTAETLSPIVVDAWARLQRVSGTTLERIESKLKSAGFPPLAWYDVLLELRRAAPAGLRPVEIEKQTLLAQYNVSRLIDRLVAAGLAEKQKSTGDGRGVTVQLAVKGAALLEEMWPVYRSAIQSEFAKHLSEKEAETLFEILGKILPQTQEEDHEAAT